MPPLGEEDAAPPPYSSHATSAVDTPVFDGSEWSNARNVELPTATQCMTHLKLLHAFARLRREVGNTERLYGIEFEWEESGENVPDEEGTVGGKDGQPREVHATSGTTALVGRQEAGMLAERMREKRWTVFVNKAVDRFEKWWESLPSGSDVFNAALQTSHFDSTGSWESKQVSKLSVCKRDGSFLSRFAEACTTLTALTLTLYTRLRLRSGQKRVVAWMRTCTSICLHWTC